MKFALKSLVIASAFVAMGAAQAATTTQTLNVNSSVTDQGWTLDKLSGNGTLTFSDSLISALNTAKVSIAPVSPATVSGVAGVAPGSYPKGGAVSAAAPITSVTGNFDGTTLSVTTVRTAGGAAQTTIKNGATNGAGFLEIKNLEVDIVNKIVYADLSGGNGFVSVNRYALWTFEALGGPTSFSVPNPAVKTDYVVSNDIHGLFFVNQADGLAKFTQALNLNSIGSSALKSVDNKASTTNIDNTTFGGTNAPYGKAAGFGWINSTIKVTATPAIPEPSTYALMGLGLVGLSLVARRKAK